MTRTIHGLLTLGLAVALSACGGDDDTNNANNNNTNNTNNNNTNNTNTCDYDSVAKVQAFLEGKTLVMNGNNIPTHPNGIDRNVNAGAATQCVFETKIEVVNGQFQVVTKFAELSNAPNVGDVGMCDVNTEVAVTPFDPTSTGVLVENVATDCTCFDVSVTYPGFSQEGRAQVSSDGTTVSMELYFQGQAAGHRCADGAVGDTTVTLDGNAFSGDAVQVYAVQ